MIISMRFLRTLSLSVALLSCGLAMASEEYAREFPSDTPLSVVTPTNIGEYTPEHTGWTSDGSSKTTTSYRVGVGTTSPRAAIDVDGDIYVSGNYTGANAHFGVIQSGNSIYVDGTTNPGTIRDSHGAINFTSTKIGIGVPSPFYMLDIDGGIGLTGRITSTLADGISPLAVTSTTLNTNLNADLLDGYHASQLGLSGLTAGKLPKASSATTIVDSVIYENGGNVGINTTSPSAPLQVVNPSTFVAGSGGTETTILVGSTTYRVHTFTSTTPTTFTAPSPATNLQILVVGGGGNASTNNSGGSGGGAGEYYYNSSYSSTAGQVFNVSVGAAATNTTFGDITMLAGANGVYGANGLNGGSGSGGSSAFAGGNKVGGTSTKTIGLGNSGGDSANGYSGAGGGGAGGSGGSATSNNGPGNGGSGVSNDITGTLTWYAAGGGGGNYYANQSSGGSGVGAAGNYNHLANNTTPPTANTGSGGGAGSGAGYVGATGIVVVRYVVPDAPTSIIANGKVGVNTTPTAMLDVKGSGSSSTTSGLKISNASNSVVMQTLDSGFVGVGSTSPTSQLEIKNSSTTPFQITNSVAGDYLTVTSAGYIGIGTTIPASALDVKGELRVYPASSPAIIRLGVSGVEKGAIKVDSNSKMYFETAGLTRATIDASGNVGIGTSVPAYKLDVVGTNATSGVRSGIGFDIYKVPDPTAPTGVVSAGGSVDTGAHWYSVTYTTALGESHPTYTSAQITTTAGNNTVTLTIPVSTDSRVTGRKIYRTRVGDAKYLESLLTTIADNTTTTYVDTLADASLPAATSVSYFRFNTTSKAITTNGTPAIDIDAAGTIVGYGAGRSAATGGRYTIVGKNAGSALTTASDSNFFGENAGSMVTTGSANHLFGYNAAMQVTTGGQNTAMGHDAMVFAGSNSSSNSAFGYGAGWGVAGNTYSNNAMFGANSGYSFTTGSYNTLLGTASGYNLTTGANNVMVGAYAGRYIADSATANATTQNSIYIGYNAKASANGVDNEISIGKDTIGNGSNSVTIGNASNTKTILKGNVGIGTITPTQTLDVRGTASMGGLTSRSRFEADGTYVMDVDASVYDDMTADMVRAKATGSRVTINDTENTADFLSTALTTDYIPLSFQFSHARKNGAQVFPHIHYEQTSAQIPNWMLQYRWQLNGGTKTTSWTNLKCNTNVFTYTSGVLNQIANGAAITPPANDNISDVLQIRVIRDTNNTSGLFAGADPLGSTASVTATDVHYEKDTIGSRSEYAK